LKKGGVNWKYLSKEYSSDTDIPPTETFNLFLLSEGFTLEERNFYYYI
jgi:hypothetical protein